MLDLARGQYRVDGVVSLYAIFHTPRARHAELLATLRSFLPVSGSMLITPSPISSGWRCTGAISMPERTIASSRKLVSPSSATRSTERFPANGTRSSWLARSESAPSLWIPGVWCTSSATRHSGPRQEILGLPVAPPRGQIGVRREVDPRERERGLRASPADSGPRYRSSR